MRCHSYNVDQPLAKTFADGKTAPLLTIPDCKNYEGFMNWIQNMPDIKNPGKAFCAPF